MSGRGRTVSEVLTTNTKWAARLTIGGLVLIGAALLSGVLGVEQLEGRTARADSVAQAATVALAERDTTLGEVRDSLAGVTAENALLEERLATAIGQAEAARIDSSNVYLRRGVAAAQRGRYTEAVGHYDVALGFTPESPVLYDYKGYALYRDGQIAEAIGVFRAGIARAPAYPWTSYNLALAYWAAGERDLALEQIERVLEIDPAFADTMRKDRQYAPLLDTAAVRALLDAASPR